MVAYNLNIPDAPNNPSADQPLMKINTNAVNTILSVDHIGFNATNGGEHQFVRMPSIVAPPAPAGTASVINVAVGTATSNPELFFQNANGNFHISPIKAWGFANTGGIVSGQSQNIVSVVRNSAGRFTVTMTANAVTGTNYAIIIGTFSNGPGAGENGGYTITSATQFNLNFVNLIGTAFADPPSFGFMVLQI